MSRLRLNEQFVLQHLELFNILNNIIKAGKYSNSNLNGTYCQVNKATRKKLAQEKYKGLFITGSVENKGSWVIIKHTLPQQLEALMKNASQIKNSMKI